MAVYFNGQKKGITQIKVVVAENLDAELNTQDELLNELETNINNLPTISSGGETDGKYFVKVIDYDGTVLKERHLNEGDTFTLPDSPTNRPRLIFQEWSSPVDIIDNTITVENSNITIGAIYTTASGLSEFDIELTKAIEADITTNGYVVTLNMDGTKDWGDGTSNTETTHTYYAYGKYTITCDGTTFTTSSSNQLFGQGGGSSNVNEYCTAIRFANITGLSQYCLTYCYNLKTITLPNTVTSTGTDGFSWNRNLTALVLPNAVNSIGGGYFSRCYRLKNLVLPKNTNIGYGGSNQFNSCYSLENVNISQKSTRMNSTFQSCYNLTSITIPSSITQIGSRTFYICSNIILYDFTKATAVPALGNSDAFYDINVLARIIVPDALYDEWIAATNWATLTNYIYKASEVV